MIQVPAQASVFVMHGSDSFRKGIDGMAAVARVVLGERGASRSSHSSTTRHWLASGMGTPQPWCNASRRWKGAPANECMTTSMAEADQSSVM
jgi:hypothetical protein